METEIEECQHLFVEHDTVLCPTHGAHGAWECATCEEEFIPLTEVEDEVEKLQLAIAGLVMANTRLEGRFVAAITLWVGTVVGAIVL